MNSAVNFLRTYLEAIPLSRWFSFSLNEPLKFRVLYSRTLHLNRCSVMGEYVTFDSQVTTMKSEMPL